jgi:hypothetical protein
VAQARLSVRKIREVLPLKAEARLSDRQIAAVIGSARSMRTRCSRGCIRGCRRHRANRRRIFQRSRPSR